MMTLQEKAGHRLLSTPVCHKRKQGVWNRHLPTWKGWAVIAEHSCTHCRNTAVLGFPGGSLVVANKCFLKSLGIESLLLNEIDCLMEMMLKHFFIFISFIISFSQMQDYMNVTGKGYIPKGFVSNSLPCPANKWLLIFNYRTGHLRYILSYSALSILLKKLIVGHKNCYCLGN